MAKINIIHIGKSEPFETIGKKYEYIPYLLEPPYIELMDFEEFKKIMKEVIEKHKIEKHKIKV